MGMLGHFAQQFVQDGIELFHGEICVLPVKGDENQVCEFESLL